ncbi:MAG: hypothetical protein F4160_13045 [Rhodospirillaceae bacterium]|nr:hypothetical protein [Rhodospirillaceae bacterium]MYH37708.1 hypothetical protein [Rhodospirillaceae bacterium]MYK15768.1 hypothetical protein [Rhodospirillaceae bacterium]
MTGRASTGTPPAAQRAQALIAGFLNRHRQLVAAGGGDPDADPDASAPPVRARNYLVGDYVVGDYAVYAVHFANRASALCADALPGPMDDEASFAFACEPLGAGLGLAPRDAAELMVRILLRTPHNADGSELDDTQIGALSKDELRWILIAEIAQRDAETAAAAFEGGESSVTLSQSDIEPLADLLDLSVIPDPDHERLAAEIERRQS